MSSNKVLEEKLREAASFGDTKALKELIQMGVNLNSRNSVNGWTALHWAAYRNYGDIVSLLLNAGADKNILNVKGEAPHSLATDSGVQELLGGPIVDRKQSELPIVPNYLQNLSVCSLSDYQSYTSPYANQCHLNISSSPYLWHQPVNKKKEELELRIRQNGDTDFIEIVIPYSELSFEKLKTICRTELNFCIQKIRKLPNTIVRNNRDVEKLKDFDELEVFKQV